MVFLFIMESEEFCNNIVNRIVASDFFTLHTSLYSFLFIS